MKIGKLRHRITIQEYTETRDSFGAEIKNWTDKAFVYASVTPVSGREYYAASQVHSEVTAKVLIRYLPGIESTMRVLFDGRVFEILSVINTEEKNTELVLMCKETSGNG